MHYPRAPRDPEPQIGWLVAFAFAAVLACDEIAGVVGGELVPLVAQAVCYRNLPFSACEVPPCRDESRALRLRVEYVSGDLEILRDVRSTLIAYNGQITCEVEQ